MEAFFNELFRCVATLDGQERATLEARIRTAREPMVGRDAIDRVTVFVSAFLGDASVRSGQEALSSDVAAKAGQGCRWSRRSLARFARPRPLNLSLNDATPSSFRDVRGSSRLQRCPIPL